MYTLCCAWLSFNKPPLAGVNADTCYYEKFQQIAKALLFDKNAENHFINLTRFLVDCLINNVNL